MFLPFAVFFLHRKHPMTSKPGRRGPSTVVPTILQRPVETFSLNVVNPTPSAIAATKN
jgi:hypothetical protein